MPIAFLAFALLGADPQPDVRPILEEWQRHSTALTSVDFRFTREDKDPRWATSEHHPGRAVLSKKGPSALENTNKSGQSVRFIWTGEATHQIDAGNHIVWPTDEKDKGRLPSLLALPFLWNVSVDTLTARYRVELLSETPEAWLLKFSPLQASNMTAFLHLDRKTYLPQRYRLVGHHDWESQDYKVTDIRINAPVAEDFTRLPEGKRTKQDESMLGRWILRSFKPDMLP